MAGLSPRRLTGSVLKLTARGGAVPLLGGGLRAVGKGLLGLDQLHDADLQGAPARIAPPRPSDPAPPAGADDADDGSGR